jgi:hypothetical protein
MAPQAVRTQFSQMGLGDIGALGGALENGPLEIEGKRKLFWAFNDFLTAEEYTAGGVPWTETETDASASITLTTSTPGTLILNAGTVDATGTQTQIAGTPLNFERGHAMLLGAIGPAGNGKNAFHGFGCRVKADIAAAGHIFAGMAGTDSTLVTAATGIPAPGATVPMIAFYSQGASLYAYSHRSTSLPISTLVATLANDTYVELAFRSVHKNAWAHSGTTVDPTMGYTEFWVNGVKKATHNGYVGGGIGTTYRPSFAATNGVGSDIVLTVDYFWQFAQRLAI